MGASTSSEDFFLPSFRSNDLELDDADKTRKQNRIEWNGKHKVGWVKSNRVSDLFNFTRNSFVTVIFKWKDARGQNWHKSEMFNENFSKLCKDICLKITIENKRSASSLMISFEFSLKFSYSRYWSCIICEHDEGLKKLLRKRLLEVFHAKRHLVVGLKNSNRDTFCRKNRF